MGEAAAIKWCPLQPAPQPRLPSPQLGMITERNGEGQAGGAPSPPLGARSSGDWAERVSGGGGEDVGGVPHCRCSAYRS